MFSRKEMIGINYIMARQETGLDDSFIYVEGNPGLDYYQFYNFHNGTKYGFRILLPESFPFDSPALLLDSPPKLQGYQNNPPLNQLGSSHNFHLNGTRNGCIDICYASSSWKSNSCVSLLILKAILWCDAYSRYLKDGKCIDVHLAEIRRQLEDKNNV